MTYRWKPLLQVNYVVSNIFLCTNSMFSLFLFFNDNILLYLIRDHKENQVLLDSLGLMGLL
jgi:hypothetical protein